MANNEGRTCPKCGMNLGQKHFCPICDKTETETEQERLRGGRVCPKCGMNLGQKHLCPVCDRTEPESEQGNHADTDSPVISASASDTPAPRRRRSSASASDTPAPRRTRQSASASDTPAPRRTRQSARSSSRSRSRTRGTILPELEDLPETTFLPELEDLPETTFLPGRNGNTSFGDITLSPLGEGTALDELDGADITKLLFAVMICIGIFPALKWYFGIGWTNTLILGGAAVFLPVLTGLSTLISGRHGLRGFLTGFGSLFLVLLPSLIICTILKCFFGSALWLVLVPIVSYILYAVGFGFSISTDKTEVFAGLLISLPLFIGVSLVVKWIFGVDWMSSVIAAAASLLILGICALTFSARNRDTAFGESLLMYTLFLGLPCLAVCIALKWIFGLAWWIALVAFVFLLFGMLIASAFD